MPKPKKNRNTLTEQMDALVQTNASLVAAMDEVVGALRPTRVVPQEVHDAIVELNARMEDVTKRVSLLERASADRFITELKRSSPKPRRKARRR